MARPPSSRAAAGTWCNDEDVETWDAIRTRRDVRQFADRQIADKDLDRVLEAGRRSPSSQNWQPWDFVVVTDRAQLKELSRVWRAAGHVATSAATIALVGPILTHDHQRETLWYDFGQATMSIMLEATDLGIGSGHSGSSGPTGGRSRTSSTVDGGSRARARRQRCRRRRPHSAS